MHYCTLCLFRGFKHTSTGNPATNPWGHLTYCSYQLSEQPHCHLDFDWNPLSPFGTYDFSIIFHKHITLKSNAFSMSSQLRCSRKTPGVKLFHSLYFIVAGQMANFVWGRVVLYCRLLLGQSVAFYVWRHFWAVSFQVPLSMIFAQVHKQACWGWCDVCFHIRKWLTGSVVFSPTLSLKITCVHNDCDWILSCPLCTPFRRRVCRLKMLFNNWLSTQVEWASRAALQKKLFCHCS